MSKFEYKYVDPTDRGGVKFRVSKKQHKKILGKHLQRTLLTHYEYFYFTDKIEIFRFSSITHKLLELFLAPIGIIIFGVIDWNESIYNMLHERSSGHFTSTIIWNSERDKDRFNALALIAKKKISNKVMGSL